MEISANRTSPKKKKKSGNFNQTIKQRSIAFCELDPREILDNENTRHSSLASDHLLAASSNPLFVRTIWKLPRSGTSSVLYYSERLMIDVAVPKYHKVLGACTGYA